MDTEQKIREIQSAIQQLEAIKTHLDKNTSEVKSSLNTTFLRHLRSLWNRQVFLANQVDLIHSSKEEVLHGQLVRLHSLLTSLQGQLGGTGTNIPFDMNDLRPEETPYISFRADSASLKDAIVNYGRVDHTGFPLTAQFMDPRSPAASLPPHFEDYDDAEHHILYKTVEEIKHAKTKSRDIDVHIPKLSACPEDWLTHSTAATTTTSALQPTFAFPAFSKNPSDWLKSSSTEVSGSGRQPIMSVISPDKLEVSPSVSFCSAPSTVSGMSGSCTPRGVPTFSSTTSSIDTWLLQIKQNPDMEEEDDFEIVDGSVASGVLETEDMMDQTSGTTPVVDISYWTASPREEWLLKSASQPTANDQTHAPDVIGSYLAERNDDLSLWLAPKQKSGCCGDSCCDKPEKPLEIENLGNYLADKLWIKSSSRTEKEEIGSVCKANEPCQSFKDCLGTPSCLEEHHRISGTSVADLPGFSIFKHGNDNQKWLANGGKNVGPTTRCTGIEQFHQASKEISDWLLNEKNIQLNNPETTEFPVFLEKPDSQVWLRLDDANRLPPKSTPFLSCATWDKVTKQHGEIDIDQWLLPSMAHSITDMEKAAPDNDQEIWLLQKESMETETHSKEQIFKFPYDQKSDSFWLCN